MIKRMDEVDDWLEDDDKFGKDDFPGFFNADDELSVAFQDLWRNTMLNVKVKIPGWIVADDSGDLWFFPGMDNKPEKENGEWTGFNPIRPEYVEVSDVERRLLKDKPKLVITANYHD